MNISIRPAPNFNFKRTVLSHGWCTLKPFEFDQQSWTLIRVLEADTGAPVTVRIRCKRKAIVIELDRPVGARVTAAIERDVLTCCVWMTISPAFTP